MDGWDEYCCFKIYRQHQVFQRKAFGNAIVGSCGMVCQAGKSSPWGAKVPLARALSPAPIWDVWDCISRCILCWFGQKRRRAHTHQCLTKGTGRAGVVPSPGSFGSWMILGQAQESQKPSTHRNGVTRDWLKLFWTQFRGFLLVIPQGSTEAGAIPTQVPRKDPG